jgi:hypothetical protein
LEILEECRHSRIARLVSYTIDPTATSTAYAIIHTLYGSCPHGASSVRIVVSEGAIQARLDGSLTWPLLNLSSAFDFAVYSFFLGLWEPVSCLRSKFQDLSDRCGFENGRDTKTSHFSKTPCDTTCEILLVLGELKMVAPAGVG